MGLKKIDNFLTTWWQKWKNKGYVWCRWEKLRWEKSIEYLIEIENKMVLDVGCKCGYFAEILKQNKNVVYGIDIDNYKKEFEHIGIFYQHDLNKGLPFEILNFQFDFIHVNGLLEHIINLDKLMDDFKKVLKDNGVLLVSVPTEKLNLIGKFLYIFYLFFFKIGGSYIKHSLWLLSKLLKINIYGYLQASSDWEHLHVWKRSRTWWENKFHQHGFKKKSCDTDRPKISYFFVLQKI